MCIVYRWWNQFKYKSLILVEHGATKKGKFIIYIYRQTISMITTNHHLENSLQFFSVLSFKLFLFCSGQQHLAKIYVILERFYECLMCFMYCLFHFIAAAKVQHTYIRRYIFFFCEFICFGHILHSIVYTFSSTELTILTPPQPNKDDLTFMPCGTHIINRLEYDYKFLTKRYIKPSFYLFIWFSEYIMKGKFYFYYANNKIYNKISHATNNNENKRGQ